MSTTWIMQFASDAEAHYHLGLAYIAAGDQVSAMKQFETLTKIDEKLAERLSVAIQTGSTNPRE